MKSLQKQVLIVIRIAVTDTFSYIDKEGLVFSQKRSRLFFGELAERSVVIAVR